MANCEVNFTTVISAEGNITCRKANTFKLSFAVTNNIDPETPINWDIEQYDKMQMEVKESSADTTPILTLLLGDGLTVAANVVQMDRTAEQMLIDAKEYIYDTIGTDGSGNETTIYGGKFTVIDTVTIADD